MFWDMKTISPNILPGEIKQVRQYEWYDSSFVKVNIDGYMHTRTNENVNSDYLGDVLLPLYYPYVLGFL